MALYFRMALYLLGGVLAGQGIAVFDAEAGTITFKIESLTTMGAGLTAFAATFLTSRIAKARGGAT